MKKIIAIAVLMSLGACSGRTETTDANKVQSAQPAENAQVFNHAVGDDVLTKMFVWWNGAYGNPGVQWARHCHQYDYWPGSIANDIRRRSIRIRPFIIGT